MQRFFIDTGSLQDSELIINDEGIVHQISRVLRMREGERCIALDNSGFEFLCEISSISKIVVRGKILEKRKNMNESPIRITLYQALPKKTELFEWVLQKGTEIGISTFVQLISKRTERDRVSNSARLTKILTEAAEQSERGVIPTLDSPIDFEKALASDTDSLKIVLHSRGTFPQMADMVPEILQEKQASIFVGPEGGFAEDEILFAQEKGARIASLGPRILRTETAGIVAGSLVLYAPSMNM